MDGHAEGCPGAHTGAVTCAEATEDRAWAEKWRGPWQCRNNPFPTGWGLHSAGEDDDTCVYCGVKLSALPRADPEDAPWRRRARGGTP